MLQKEEPHVFANLDEEDWIHIFLKMPPARGQSNPFDLANLSSLFNSLSLQQTK